MRRRKELLSKNLRGGTIYIIPILKFKHIEISMLELLPYSYIKKHKHILDSEMYIVPKLLLITVCKKGKSHMLRNPINQKLRAISIKWR